MIVVAQLAQGTDGDRFLANAQMEQTDDLALGVEQGQFFLKGADEPHAAQ
jgi:hypothetical protein